MNKFYFILPFCLLIWGACSTTQSPISQAQQQALPTILKKGLAAHGGLAQWNKMNTLKYSIERNEKPEHHLIDLKSRKVLLTHEDYKLGFDGKEVWVNPTIEAFGKGSPRFYHNLIFYFYAIPFVLADPGINYEVLPQKEIEGQQYHVLKVSYQSGVGDAPDDYYIAHFNTTTNRMEWLLYTVTYYSGEKSEKYNALKYDWQEVNGLWIPSKLTGYKYEEGEITDFRYSRLFNQVSITSETTNPVIFEMPKEAAIDPLKRN